MVEVRGSAITLAPACATGGGGMESDEHHPGAQRPEDRAGAAPFGPPEGLPHLRQERQLRAQEMAERFCLRENRYEGPAVHLQKGPFSLPGAGHGQVHHVSALRDHVQQVQTVGALSGVNRGFTSVVAPAFGKPLEESVYTFCGQCAAVCPTGALVERDYSWQVIEALADPEKVVVVQTAPAVPPPWGRGVRDGARHPGDGQDVPPRCGALGFDHVFDTDFAADLTIMEEARC